MYKQRGYSLVLILAVMASLAGVAMAERSNGLRALVPLNSAVAINAELRLARQALLSYTAHYAYLYGAKGAGIGHMPCPDTNSLESQSTGWAVNHGPNPPCGRQAVAVGNLPAHISFNEGRYMIHAGFDSRVEYAVSSQFINNPANRAVNPGLLSQSQADFPYTASLRKRSSRVSSNRIYSSEVVITKKALMLSIRPAVAAWLTNKSNREFNTDCELNQQSLEKDKLPELDNRCFRIKQFVLRCLSESSQTNLWHLASDKYYLNILLLYLADEVHEPLQCEKDIAEQLLIDDTPAMQHWFFQNGWLDWLSIEHEAECVHYPRKPCRLTYMSQSAVESLHNPVTLRWRRI